MDIPELDESLLDFFRALVSLTLLLLTGVALPDDDN